MLSRATVLSEFSGVASPPDTVSKVLGFSLENEGLKGITSREF